MKIPFYILLAVIITGIIVSCTKPTHPLITEVGLLHDITGKQTVKPDSQRLLAMFDFSGDKKWNGAIFHYSEISDVSYNPNSEAKIDTADMWFSNELEREKEIKKFNNEVKSIVGKSQQHSEGKNNSSIYLPIVKELNELAKSKAQRRVLLIYSDLMENTGDISFYNKKQFKLLIKNPEAIQKQLEQIQPLQNLNGIEIYLIYQPTDSESDKVFTVVSEFYKKLLEGKGAKVTIAANI